jgi:hypothetical protein
VTARKFHITLEVEAVVEIDDAVIAAVDDDWRDAFYDLTTPTEIAELIGQNMIMQHMSLSDIDGFADHPDARARVVGFPDWIVTECEEL